LNYNDPLTDEDRRLFDTIHGMDAIIVINKTDLEKRIDLDEVKKLAGNRKIIHLSVREEKGIDELEETISNMYMTGEIENDDFTYISNARHVALLNQALQSINDALSALENDMPVDLVQIDMTKAWELLGEII